MDAFAAFGGIGGGGFGAAGAKGLATVLGVEAAPLLQGSDEVVVVPGVVLTLLPGGT